ncbi:MAG: hypothetical protein LBD33_01700 [Puniceicoccales bacterium]|jgi:hypothetical protein|nr:hypothetical protein [Puniceicoccales bacterium]
MNSVGVRTWTERGLHALNVQDVTKDVGSQALFSHHLRGTKTESINFSILAKALPKATIDLLRKEFPQISSANKTNAEFLYAAICNKLGNDGQAPAFARGRVFFRSVPQKLAATFSQAPANNSSIMDLIKESIGDLKLRTGKSISEDQGTITRLVNASADSVDLNRLAKMLTSETMKSINLQLPKDARKSCKTNGDLLCAFMRTRLGPERAELLSAAHGMAQIQTTTPAQNLSHLQPTRRASSSVARTAASQPSTILRRSFFRSKSATIETAALSTLVGTDSKQKLIAATRLDLKEVKENGILVFEDQNKNEISAIDIGFLSKCVNLNILNLTNNLNITQLDLGACTKLQHLNLRGCSKLAKVILPAGRGAMDRHGSISVDSCPAFPRGMNLEKLQAKSSGQIGPIIFEERKSDPNLNVTRAATSANISENERKLLAATELEFKGMKGNKYVFSMIGDTVEMQDLSFLGKCVNLKVLIFNDFELALKTLDLSNCKNLECFECRWCDNISEIKFHPDAELRAIQLQDCKNLRAVTMPVGRGLQVFSGDGCPAFAGITTNVQVQVVANAFAADPKLENWEVSSGWMTAFRRTGTQVIPNDNGTTTFSAPVPTKRSFFSRLFGRK